MKSFIPDWELRKACNRVLKGSPQNQRDCLYDNAVRAIQRGELRGTAATVPVWSAWSGGFHPMPGYYVNPLEFIEWARARGIECADYMQGMKPQTEPPGKRLNPTERAVRDVLNSLPNDEERTAKNLTHDLEKMGVFVTELAIRRHVIPSLRRNGVPIKNDGRGYYIAQ